MPWLRAWCRLYCRHTQSTFTASRVWWIVSIAGCKLGERSCAWSCLICTWSKLRLYCVAKGVRKGVGVKKPPWAWYFTKFIAYAKEINGFRILFACRLNANTTNWICMQISRNIVNGPKSNNYVSVESALSSASRNQLTTFCRSFVHYAYSRLCSAIVHFIRNNGIYFVC